MFTIRQVRAQRKIDRDVNSVDHRSYAKPVLESHLDLLNLGTFSDVTFIVGPSKERVSCHQLFLKARSPVFEVMFSERWNQGGTIEILLEDVDPEVFKKLLQFVYTDALKANASEALELLQIAPKYEFQSLVTKCERLLESEVTLDDAVDVFQAARKYGKIQLMDKAGDVMAMSLSKLQTLPSFSRVDKQTLEYILQRNDLKMKEVDLFLLAVQWAENQASLTAPQSLQDILPLIRFPVMTLEEFRSTVVPTGLLSQSTLIELFTYFGTDNETKKSMASTLKFSARRRVIPNQVDRLLPAVSVPLYSRDFVNCSIRHERYLTLKECLQFNVLDVVDTRPTPSSLTTSETEQKNIVLSSISFYCPQTAESVNHWHWGMASTITKEFKIHIKAKSCLSASYEDLYTRCHLKIEEGKMAEFEFDGAVPLESGLHYSIIVEEMTNSEGLIGIARDQIDGGVYEVRKFGNIQRRVAAEMGQKLVHFEFAKCSGHFKPQLIFKLGLKEC